MKIPAVNTKKFNPTAEPVMHLGIPTNEANVETLTNSRNKNKKTLFKTFCTFL